MKKCSTFPKASELKLYYPSVLCHIQDAHWWWWWRRKKRRRRRKRRRRLPLCRDAVDEFYNPDQLGCSGLGLLEFNANKCEWDVGVCKIKTSQEKMFNNDERTTKQTSTHGNWKQYPQQFISWRNSFPRIYTKQMFEF